MSTFDGIVREFPDIRIDYFRLAGEQSRPPLAYFLSHVHSDHLTGLESCKSPFIYCSPATREILLRLEKYPHRMNFAKGILETRRQTYRHLKNLLKPIPLETPTVLELSPGKTIRVTLFDANHCVGAVMFLIEGEGKAILYTGDIRSESWWVSSLTRHPLLIPYVCSGRDAPMKRLNNIYLDTTFASKDDLYREFPSKGEGLTELLKKLSAYPRDTRFFFDSWTFGYEDVWQALSAFLDSQIHLDDYRLGLYRSLANGSEPRAVEAPKLMGFHCGNHFQQGTLSSAQTRLHSCEKGTGCEIWSQEFVRITPIISRHNGQEVSELGAGGGQGDLDQRHELEVDDIAQMGQLITLCASTIQDQPELRAGVLEKLTSIINGQVQSIPLDSLAFNEHDNRDIEGRRQDPNESDDLPLDMLVAALTTHVSKGSQRRGLGTNRVMKEKGIRPSPRLDGLPTQITFPYSRHSSYAELCLLIEAFRPRDIHPCTVDKASWTPINSMSSLFGHLYPLERTFSHDQKMLKAFGERPEASFLPPRPRSRSDDNRIRDRSDRNGSIERDRSPVHAKPIFDAPRRENWPPVTVDHYSPPRKRKSIERETETEHRLSKSRRGSVTADVAAVALQTLLNKKARSAARKHCEPGAPLLRSERKSFAPDQLDLEFGRLSREEEEITDGDDDDSTSTNHSRKTSLHRPSSSLHFSSPKSAVRHALREVASDAVRGIDDMMWSEVGLVSTNGHQDKEEEM